MGVGGEDDKLENGNAGGGGFFESFKVTGKAEAGASGRQLHWNSQKEKVEASLHIQSLVLETRVLCFTCTSKTKGAFLFTSFKFKLSSLA